MRKLIILLPLLLAACAGTQGQQVLEACRAHNAAVQVLIPQAAAGALSQGQVDAVDQSIALTNPICDGTVRDYSSALGVLEGELTRVLILGAE